MDLSVFADLLPSRFDVFRRSDQGQELMESGTKSLYILFDLEEIKSLRLLGEPEPEKIIISNLNTISNDKGGISLES